MRALHHSIVHRRLAATPSAAGDHPGTSRRRRARVALAACVVMVATALMAGPGRDAVAGEATPLVEQALSTTTSGAAASLPAWSPRSDELLLVAVAHQAWRNLTVGVSGNGLQFERLAQVRNAQNVETITVFRAQGNTTVSGPISVSLPNNAGAASVIAMRLSGVPVGGNGAGAIRSVASSSGPSAAQGDNANMKTAVQASTGDLVVGLGTNRLRTFAVPPGQHAAAVNVASGTDGQRISASAWSLPAMGSGSATIGADRDLVGGSGVDDWAMVGLAVAPASTTSTPTTSTPSTTTSTTVAPTTTTSTTITTVPASRGVRPYDTAGPWNTPIASNPVVDANSSSYVRAISDNNLPLTSDADQYTIPVYEFDDATPRRTVKMSGYFSSYDNGDSSRVGYGFAATITGVPIPTHAVAPPGSDGQIVIWDPKTGIEYGFWQFGRDASGGYIATNGYRYHTTAGYNGRFADGMAGRGAGTPYFAGLVRKWEIEQGRIDHALAFAYKSPSSQFVYPASKSDGGNFGGVTGVDLPEGARLQLNPALTETDFNRWGLSPAAKVIARALQQYGMYVVDHSGSSKIYLEARATAGWDSSVTRDLVAGIPWSEFRVVS